MAQRLDEEVMADLKRLLLEGGPAMDEALIQKLQQDIKAEVDVCPAVKGEWD